MIINAWSWNRTTYFDVHFLHIWNLCLMYIYVDHMWSYHTFDYPISHPSCRPRLALSLHSLWPGEGAADLRIHSYRMTFVFAESGRKSFAKVMDILSDKSPEYINFMSKCTSWNVMVGITRSKVICLFCVFVASHSSDLECQVDVSTGLAGQSWNHACSK